MILDKDKILKDNKDKKLKMEYENYSPSPIFVFLKVSGIFLTGSYLVFNLLSKPTSFVSKLGRYLWYSPGEGSVSVFKKGKRRVCQTETELGTMTLPIMKMSSFENVYGFFEEDLGYPVGMMELDKFLDLYSGQFPTYKPLDSTGDYIILNHRRPRDFHNKDSVYGFIKSDIDGLIYVYLVENNDLIQYENIDANYCELIENYEPPPPLEDGAEEERIFDFNIGGFCTLDGRCFNGNGECQTDTELEESISFLKSMSQINCNVEYTFDRDYRIDDHTHGCCGFQNNTTLEPNVSFDTNVKKMEESLSNIKEESEDFVHLGEDENGDDDNKKERGDDNKKEREDENKKDK